MALARKRGINRLKKKIHLNPTEPENYFRLAQLCQTERQYREAKEILSQLLDQEHDRQVVADAYLLLAEICLDQGAAREALGYWERASHVAETSSSNPSIHELHGRILLALYRGMELEERDKMVLEQAIESFQHAATFDRDSELLASIYLGLGMAYHDKGLLDKAADYLNKALALQPEDRQLIAECHLQLGAMELWDHENPEKAIPLFQVALETSPLSPPSNWLAHGYWCLSHALVQIGKPQEAIDIGKKSLEGADSNDFQYPMALVTAHSVLGWAYYHIAGEEDQAIYHYLQALAVEEDSATYRYLGELYFHKGEFSQALEMFEAVLRVDPDYQHPGDIYNAIGVCLACMNRHQEALSYLEWAQREQATITFKPFQVYKNVGWSYWHLDKYDEAAEAFKTALGLMRPKDKEYRRIEWYLREVLSRKPPSMT